MGSGLPALLLVAGRCMASRVDVILQVFVIFAAAKAAGEVFVRLDLPAIAGELLVGILLGPHVAGLIEVNQTTETLAELGIVILLFTVGLETPVSGLIRVGRSSLITSVAGILAAGSTAVLVMVAFGFSLHEGLLVGIVVFIGLVIVPGSRITRRHPTILEQAKLRRAPFVLALTLCLGLAALAEQVGLAALVGAFLAGMVLAETRERYELDRRMLPLFDFLVPFFFVVAAARMDPGAVLSGHLGLTVTLVAVTIVAKLAGCAAGAAGLSARRRLQVGAGMIPRNEVALVVAAAGRGTGALSADLFSVLVAAVIVSTLIAPPLLRALIPPSERGPERALEGPPEAPGGEEGHNGS